jgi:tRNA modification GTPase
MANSERDPIAAIATAPGRGGIGVIRISGQQLAAFAQVLCARGSGGQPQPLMVRHATLLSWRDARGEPIDRGIMLWFAAPHSYTGEDVIELQGHGGPVVMGQLMARVLELGRAHAPGLRLAEPGEFTRRAFLNGQMDLAQAEAVADLIDASTTAAARAAMRALEGRFSDQINTLVNAVIELRALIEATIDFPEEDDVDVLAHWDAQGRLDAIRSQWAQLLEGARQGLRLRQGMTVVLIGAPNVGKSSLLNALAGQDLAIVSPLAGTTRDRIEHAFDVQGLAMTLVDTAGLRESIDPIERIGMERTLAAVTRADLVLELVEADDPAPPADRLELAPTMDYARDCLGKHLPAQVPVLRVRNKIDRDGLAAGIDPAPRLGADAGQVRLSAQTGAGMALLLERLRELAGLSAVEPEFIARERHLQALLGAGEHLNSADREARESLPALELFAEELRLAQAQLGSITGEFSADDLLGTIFGRFCIGK